MVDNYSKRKKYFLSISLLIGLDKEEELHLSLHTGGVSKVGFMAAVVDISYMQQGTADTQHMTPFFSFMSFSSSDFWNFCFDATRANIL